jgi:hypothetical protein
MIEKILAERGNRYGAFPDHAAISQGIKRVMMASPNWALLTDAQREALELIAHKIGRMLNGDVTYIDNGVDIVGYATLMVNAMREDASRDVG